MKGKFLLILLVFSFSASAVRLADFLDWRREIDEDGLQDFFECLREMPNVIHRSTGDGVPFLLGLADTIKIREELDLSTNAHHALLAFIQDELQPASRLVFSKSSCNSLEATPEFCVNLLGDYGFRVRMNDALQNASGSNRF